MLVLSVKMFNRKCELLMKNFIRISSPFHAECTQWICTNSGKYCPDFLNVDKRAWKIPTMMMTMLVIEDADEEREDDEDENEEENQDDIGNDDGEKKIS